MRRTSSARLAVFLGLLFVAGFSTAAVGETVVVKPSTLEQTGWKVASRAVGTVDAGERPVPGEASSEFALGSGATPAGTGSFHMLVGYADANPLPKVYLGTNRFSGIRLDRITQLKLWICPRWWEYPDAQPATVELALSKKGNLRLATFYPWGFDPSDHGGRLSWREYDLMKPGGAWSITNTDSTGNKGDWNWLVKSCPDVTILTPPADDWPRGTLPGTGLNIKLGAGGASRSKGEASWKESCGCNAYVDKLTIGYMDENGQEVVTTFDFEAEQQATLADKGCARLLSAFIELERFSSSQYDGKERVARYDAAEVKAQRLESARKEFEAIRDEFAKSANPEIAAIADCAIGEIYILGNIPHLAERAYWRAIRQYGTMPDALNALARYGVAQAMYRQGSLDKALEQCDLVLKDFTPGWVHGFRVTPPGMRGNVYLTKVVTLNDLGLLDEALAVAQSARAELQAVTDPETRQSLHETPARIQLWEGSLLAQLGRPGEAEETLQGVIDDYPGKEQAVRARLMLSELRGGE